MKGRKYRILTSFLIVLILLTGFPINISVDYFHMVRSAAAADSKSNSKQLSVEELGKNNTISEEVLATVYDVDLPEASYNDLPEWKGFNLLEKFYDNGTITEKPFQTMSELGYNFVRLPMSYLTWIKNGNWYSYDEKSLQNIDKAIEYGIKYNIHININFHRAPGFTVASPAEKYNLWTSEKAQKAFVANWRMFAKRYAGIPSSILCFNLVNEPFGVDDATYTKVMAKAIAAIRKEDPNRLIIVDGLDYATTPCTGLVKYKVAQSLHSYDPFQVTHYKASWVAGSDQWPVPQWPINSDISTFLYGPGKPEFSTPLIINGEFPAGKLGIRITQISDRARIIVEADGKKVFDKKIICTNGKGDWYKAVYHKEWNIYQNLFDKEYFCNIPADTKQIKIYMSEGDWLTFSEIKLYKKNKSVFSTIKAFNADWGSVSKEITVVSDGSCFTGDSKTSGKDYLINKYLQKWADFSKQNGIGVMVGEWGVYNQTPHDVTLALMTDKLEAYKELGFGWALWNFNGSFGIVDSGRSDVVYGTLNGYKLDEEMSDLLLKYVK